MIANYEQKRQQNYDRYNSLIQSTNHNRSNCISSVVGDSLYTIQQLNEDTIDYVCNFITMPAKLWRDSDYQSKQAFQKMMFPNGLSFNIKTKQFGTDKI